MINKIKRDTGLSEKTIRRVLDSISHNISVGLVEDQQVVVPILGCFEVSGIGVDEIWFTPDYSLNSAKSYLYE